MKEWVDQAIEGACSSLLHWAGVIAGTLVLGFCLGYWTGHGKITGARQTFIAFVWLPLMSVAHQELLFACAVAATAWYMPPHYESRWLRIVSAAANFVVWLVAVHWVVVKTAQGKFFQY